ncbi:MAG: SRPBCC family protein [Acidimicrobiales bacterium]
MGKTEVDVPAGIPQVVVTRAFDAPAELVVRAHLDPELLVQWLGPRELAMTVDRYEVRDGGRWRYVQRDPEGHEHGFHGVFHGEPSTSGIVQTFEYEGVPGHVKLDTTTFEERDGKTLVRTISCFACLEDRDGMVASGMERGVVDSGDRLDALLATLQSS